MASVTPVIVKTTSGKGNMALADWIRVALGTILTPVIPIVTATLSKGSLTFDWPSIGAAAGLGFVAVLSHALLTPAKTVITGAPEGSTVNVTTPAPGTSVAAVATK
jgi:hypothetical protein